MSGGTKWLIDAIQQDEENLFSMTMKRQLKRTLRHELYLTKSSDPELKNPLDLMRIETANPAIG